MATKGVVDDPYVDEIVEILRPYDPERIILFGSRARGQADELSDYDLIVIKRTDRSFVERLQDMVPYLVQLKRPADILVYTPEEFNGMEDTGLGWIVRQEGVTLYERTSD
ncbi:MAG: nucleotidyltransferase domain-containing protein [Dehalococcoidia bacterium]